MSRQNKLRIKRNRKVVIMMNFRSLKRLKKHNDDLIVMNQFVPIRVYNTNNTNS